MLFSADGIELAYSIGLGPQNSFSHLYLKVHIARLPMLGIAPACNWLGLLSQGSALADIKHHPLILCRATPQVGSCQVDNMMPYTKYPILLCPVTTKGEHALSLTLFPFTAIQTCMQACAYGKPFVAAGPQTTSCLARCSSSYAARSRQETLDTSTTRTSTRLSAAPLPSTYARGLSGPFLPCTTTSATRPQWEATNQQMFRL